MRVGSVGSAVYLGNFESHIQEEINGIQEDIKDLEQLEPQKKRTVLRKKTDPTSQNIESSIESSTEKVIEVKKNNWWNVGDKLYTWWHTKVVKDYVNVAKDLKERINDISVCYKSLNYKFWNDCIPEEPATLRDALDHPHDINHNQREVDLRLNEYNTITELKKSISQAKLSEKDMKSINETLESLEHQNTQITHLENWHRSLYNYIDLTKPKTENSDLQENYKIRTPLTTKEKNRVLLGLKRNYNSMKEELFRGEIPHHTPSTPDTTMSRLTTFAQRQAGSYISSVLYPEKDKIPIDIGENHDYSYITEKQLSLYKEELVELTVKYIEDELNSIDLSTLYRDPQIKISFKNHLKKLQRLNTFLFDFANNPPIFSPEKANVLSEKIQDKRTEIKASLKEAHEKQSANQSKKMNSHRELNENITSLENEIEKLEQTMKTEYPGMEQITLQEIAFTESIHNQNSSAAVRKDLELIQSLKVLSHGKISESMANNEIESIQKQRPDLAIELREMFQLGGLEGLFMGAAPLLQSLIKEMKEKTTKEINNSHEEVEAINSKYKDVLSSYDPKHSQIEKNNWKTYQELLSKANRTADDKAKLNVIRTNLDLLREERWVNYFAKGPEKALKSLTSLFAELKLPLTKATTSEDIRNAYDRMDSVQKQNNLQLFLEIFEGFKTYKEHENLQAKNNTKASLEIFSKLLDNEKIEVDYLFSNRGLEDKKEELNELVKLSGKLTSQLDTIQSRKNAIEELAKEHGVEIPSLSAATAVDVGQEAASAS